MTDKNRTTRDNRVVEEKTIPIVEERVSVGVRPVEGRSVTVTTTPVTEDVTVTQPVTSETIEITRIPIGTVVDAVPDTREDGDTTIIPVVEERVVTTVELVLVEEIHLKKTRIVTDKETTVTLRKTGVDIS